MAFTIKLGLPAARLYLFIFKPESQKSLSSATQACQGFVSFLSLAELGGSAAMLFPRLPGINLQPLARPAHLI